MGAKSTRVDTSSYTKFSILNLEVLNLVRIQSLLPDTDMHARPNLGHASVSMANAQWACYAVRTQSRGAGRAGVRRGAAGQLQAVNADARPDTDPFETQ